MTRSQVRTLKNNTVCKLNVSPPELVYAQVRVVKALKQGFRRKFTVHAPVTCSARKDKRFKIVEKFVHLFINLWLLGSDT